MPNQFRVGDRVKCIEGGGGIAGVIAGQIYTIGGYEDDLVFVNENSGCFFERRFVAYNEAPIAPTENTTTFYTLVYKTRFASRRIMGFETEEEFNEKKRTVLDNGGTVFAEKKLKLTNVGAQ